MSETPAAEQPGPGGPKIRVLAQYVRDMSFENPAAATEVMAERPDIALGVDVSARPHAAGDSIFETVLKLNATATAEGAGSPMFVCELVYGGLFEFADIDDDALERMLLIECPRLLFPYARRILADMTRDGGFPPLLVDPIDFVGLYHQQKSGRADQASPIDGSA